jgi:hypothetical protein
MAGMFGVLVPSGAEKFSVNQFVQTGSGAHPAAYTMGNRSSFIGSKVVCAWSFSPLSNAKIKNAWSYTTIPQHALMAWYSVKSKWTALNFLLRGLKL